MQTFRRFSRLGPVVLLALLFRLDASAQFATTGTVFGKITDQQGRAVSGVTVTMRSPDLVKPLAATTDANGEYRFPDVTPGIYALGAEHPEFGAIGPIELSVKVGSTLRLDYKLSPAATRREEVTVTAAAPQVETTKSESDKYIPFQAIQNLPLPNRTFLDVLATVPGVDSAIPAGTLTSRGPNNSFNILGARANQNEFLIDGAPNNDKSDLNYEDIASTQVFGGPTSSAGAGPAGATFSVGTALQTFNLDAIQEVRISTSLFSAEFGGGSGGVINVITRAGTDQLRGGVTYEHQASGLVKNPPQDFHRDQEAVWVGGPIIRGDTHFFVSYERDDRNLGYDFNQSSYEVGAFLKGLGLTANETESDRVSAKIDHVFGPQNTLTLTVNYGDQWAHVLDSIFRTSLGNLDPQFHENKAIGFIARDVHTLGSGGQLESVGYYTHNDRDFNSLTPCPRAIHLGFDANNNFFISATGCNSPDSASTLTNVGLKESYSWHSDNRSWKVGAGVDRFQQKTDQQQYLDLSYGFSPPGTPPSSALFIPVTHLSPSVTDVHAYAEQDWYITNKLTANLGLRFEHDSLVGESTVEPRIGFAYDPAGNAQSVIRAGFGIYHDRSNLIGATGADRPPVIIGAYDPTTGSVSPSTPATENIVDPNLKLPITYKVLLGYDRQLPMQFVVGVTGYASFNHDLFYLNILNRQNNDTNGTRPDPTHGDIDVYTNSGKSTVYDAELHLRRNFAAGSVIDLSYSYQHTRGNSSFDFIAGNSPLNYVVGTNQGPEPQLVSGPLDYEIKYNFKLSGVAKLPAGFLVSGILNWRTGLPFTVIESFFNPQVGGVLPEGYNSRRLPNFFKVDLRVAKSVQILGASVEIYGDIFNVTNRQNVLSVDGTSAYNDSGPIGGPGTTQNPSFLTVLSRSAARSGELGARINF